MFAAVQFASISGFSPIIATTFYERRELSHEGEGEAKGKEKSAVT